jgi:hypothetical protein
MKLIREEIEDVKVLAEETSDGKKNLFIEGVFMQAELRNKNGRSYPGSVIAKEVERYNRELVEKKRAYGELGHPQGPTINLERVSHMITKLSMEGNNVMGKAKIMDTPYGNIVKSLINEGANLGVSSRGMGSLQADKNGTQVVQKDFYLATAADIVADPSAPDAYVQGVMEGVEWVWENGILKAHELEQVKEEIEQATRSRQLEEKKIEVFERLLKTL